MKTKRTYSGTRVLDKPKTVTFVDPVNGVCQVTSKTMHRWNNGTSLVSYIQINPTTFVSINSFLGGTAGHQVITLTEALVPHQPTIVNIDTVEDGTQYIGVQPITVLGE